MRRYLQNPIITRADIPDINPHLIDVTSVFNPGAIKYGDKYLLMLRVQNRGRETFSVMAESNDGIHFKISSKIIHFNGIEKIKETIYHCYDPRITFLENTYYIQFAMDLSSGCYLGLAQTDDFVSFEFLGNVSEEDNRNGVIFPEKINGNYFRLDRPNIRKVPDGPKSGDTIFLSKSNDLLNWQSVAPVISGRLHYWDELIGPGPPPIKTEKGWLQLYHGIAMHYSPIYQAGVMLLDLYNPAKVISRGRYNILEPREIYETVGQVPNVVFPSGVIVDQLDEQGFASLDSDVYVYYGAADTSVGLAFVTINELIQATEA